MGAAATEHASGSSSISISSSRRARDLQSCARGTVGRVARGACCRVHVRAHGADRDRSPAQQPQRMPLASRTKQLSLVLDPARLSQRDRSADRPVCSPAACDGALASGDECI
eukprot:2759903-Prymnesium_polylepis.1